MNFTFETLGSSNFLVYELRPDDQLDTMSLGMLTNNSIHGLAEAVFTQMDDQKFIKYNITSKLTAATVFSSPMSKKRLLTILGSIVDGLLKAEDYMLDQGSILLDAERIFIDGATGEAVLICLPVLQDTKQPELGAFFKEVVFNWTKFEQAGDFGFMAELLNYFNSVPVLSLMDFKVLVDRLANTRDSQPRSYDNYRGRAEQTVDNNTLPSSGSGQDPRSSHRPPVDNGRASGGRKAAQVRHDQAPISPAPEEKKEENKLQFGKKGPNYGTNAPAEDEKKMSMWYLLNHFSKENLELYKAQKDAPKDAGSDPEPVKKARKKDEPVSGGRGFSIPGDPPPEFDVPGEKEKPAAAEKPAAPVLPPMTPPQTPPEREVVRFGGGDDSDLTVVGDLTVINPTVGPCLVRSETGEVIELNKPHFRIGRERRSVDYVITGNPSISKKHVEVRFQAGQFQVCDEESTNHTFVNGKRIPKKTWVSIKTGDILKLSNEEFECKLN